MPVVIPAACFELVDGLIVYFQMQSALNGNFVRLPYVAVLEIFHLSS
jgi:hypothetical protein